MEEWEDCEELKPGQKEKWTMVNKTREARMRRTEWCAAATKYRCIRCGSSIKHKGRYKRNVQDRNGCEKVPNTSREDWANHILGGHDTVRGVHRHGEALVWCRKEFGLCAAKTGTNIDESMQTGENCYERIWENVKTDPNPRRGMRESGKLKGKKRRVTRKEGKRLRKEFEVGSFMAQKE